MTEKRFNPVSLIRKKRDGGALTHEELSFLINAYSEDRLPDYQMSAFLMAAYLNGLNKDEAAELTKAMLYSGDVLDLSNIPGKKVDKHSTGGVGDKLSLILAPIVASCGVAVPMISGRGLGHTGGTLDKLESITGFTVDITLDRYREILKKHGLVMAGQTEDIAPADKRLYALRDVTATVESIPLIAGSIMSKKLAEGIDALVLDVKFGKGAFMEKHEDAVELAKTLVNIGEEFGKQTIAYLTNMDQPLGRAVGNWLEALEAAEALQGEGPEDVMQVTHLLAGTMIYLGRDDVEKVELGIELSKRAVKDGSAYDTWLKLVEEQGGDPKLLKHPERYPEPKESFEYTAQAAGYITEMKAYEVGMASLELGAGRRSKEDKIDPAAGFLIHKKRGARVEKGETILTGYTNNADVVEVAKQWLDESITIAGEKPQALSMITHKVDNEGIHQYNL